MCSSKNSVNNDRGSREKLNNKKCNSSKQTNLNPRNGWEKAFKEMHDNGDDQLLIDDTFDDERLAGN